MVKLSLNDTPVELTKGTRLSEALILWGYLSSPEEKPQCAVAINGEFVPRTRYTEITLVNGDEVDIVSAVGGG